MKKNIFLMAAASAIMLTACTSDNDVLQTAQQKQVTTQEVGFDIYTPTATNVTRAGLTGTMTTNRLQLAEQDGGGFGVYAFLTEDADGTAFNPADGTGATYYTPTAGQKPNFMANEKILWNETNLGWYYNPLKYWPNETENDSQSTPASMESNHQDDTPAYDQKHLDRLTFFAYAPYVSVGEGATGITAITDNNGQLSGTNVTDPTIKYVSTDQVDPSDAKVATDVEPDDYVDLLWGVAPAGGLSYTAVNGTTVTVDEGKPLIDMIKPDVNTSMKFLFNHALARFGINVVAAVDQVSPGGELDPYTKITINNVTISGPFGITGELNLNNGDDANIANWTTIQNDAITSGTTKAITTTQSIKVTAQGTKKAIAEHLRWTGTHDFGSYSAQNVIGVTTAKQDLLRPSSKWFSKLASAPAYSPGKKYYSSLSPLTAAKATVANGTKIQKGGKWGFLYTKNASNVYVKQASDVDAPGYPEHIYGSASTLYFVTATEHIVTTAGTKPTTIGDGVKVYTLSSGTFAAANEDDAPTYVENATYSGGTWTGAAVNDKVYTLDAVNLSNAETPYKYDPAGTYYEAERNYLYVVPTNNVAKNCDLTVDEDKVKEKALRTITVQIEYYITTKDEKVGNGYTQTKNVITKEVVLPSLANGKSYMLNLVLGLTSVKIEAEVDDWKVINGQVDLPQNTAD